MAKGGILLVAIIGILYLTIYRVLFQRTAKLSMPVVAGRTHASGKIFVLSIN